MQQKQLYNVCTYIMTSQEQLERSPDRTWWTKGTLHMHIKRRSSLFVSYLYNYFKVSTDFGFPFREKTIKPCSPGLSGESVRIISLQALEPLKKAPIFGFIDVSRPRRRFWPPKHGLRCLQPSQIFRKFNSDRFPFFKDLKRTSGTKVRSFSRQSQRPNRLRLIGSFFFKREKHWLRGFRRLCSRE